MTKPTKLNIISKLNNFSNIQVGEAPTTFYDDNMYPLLYNKYGAVSLQKNDETYLSFTNDTAKLSYMQVIDSIKTKNFQLDCTILLTQIRAENILYAFVQSINNLFFKISIKNTFRDGIIITSNNMAISANYKFEVNKKYNISVSKEDDTYTFYINGISHGYKISPVFTNNIMVGPNLTFGSNTGTTNTSTSNFRGNLYNLNISYGVTLINYKSYTKYGNHLISRQYFGNHNRVDTATLFYCNTETINESPIVWEIPQINNKEEYAVLNNSLFKTKLNGPYTITFNLKPNNVSQTSNLFTYNNYRIILNIVVPISPEPKVIVNEYTTAALNFENGLVDQIGTTVWTKEGTSDITSVNKIFGENSFETKALGDSLYTNSNVITGGSTPFTIEFYAFVSSIQPSTYNYLPLFTNDYAAADQGLYFFKSNKTLVYYRSNSTNIIDVKGQTKINANEINKITLTYDGACLRVFVNDILDLIYGVSSPIVKQNIFAFFKSKSSAINNGLNGLLDNVNIHDGIATKVRDHDPYEEFLVVDLAFDGENNSTKIVDNGQDRSQWELTTFSTGGVRYSGCKIIKNNSIFKSGFSYLDKSTVNSEYLRTFSNSLNFGSDDFTIEFEFMKTNDTPLYTGILATYCTNYTELITNKALFNISCMGGQYSISYIRNRVFFFNESEMTRKDIPSLETTSSYEELSKVDNSVCSKTVISLNVPYRVHIIRNGDKLYLYINGILECVNNATMEFNLCGNYGLALLGNAFIDSVSLIGRINYFKVYKGVAVIPEDPTGKIQLDFDNNVIDKYGNSTWTNNGLVFDQINSVKGHSIKADGALYKNIYSNSLTLNLKNNIYDFDFKVTDVNDYRIITGNKYLFIYISKTVANVYFEFYNNGAWITGYTSNVKIELNKWYNLKFVSLNDKIFIYVNDIICDVIQTPYINLTTVQDVQYISGSYGQAGYMYSGYIDNFRFENNTVINIDNINKPAVHLPLETNAINTGFTPLTINSVGNPTYTTIDGKKCIKFESGKYLAINSNNIFNLGTSSDFYIEFDFYVLTQNNKYEALIADYNTVWRDSPFILSVLNADPINNTVYDGHIYFRNAVADINNILITKNTIIRNNWNNLKFYRSNMQIYIVLNDVITESNFNVPIIFNKFTLGDNGWNQNGYLDGYMSNFKMFVGTSEIPEIYNDKKVLDLDFKPTGKSYLFKDNNNKCVIHPVNITQRDYQDSQYCCTFNGTNQYLQLGKNDLLNFGNDDFVIYFKVRIDNITPSNKDDILLSNNIKWAAGYIGIGRYRQTNKLSMGVYGTPGYNSSNTFNLGINDIIITRNGSNLTINLNGIETVFDNFTASANFNGNNSTRIGMAWDAATETFFSGIIYSIKVLRNTTDISLLEDENTDVIDGETSVSYTLSNGFDEVSISKDTITEKSIQIVKDTNKVTAIIDDEILEVPTTSGNVDTNDLYLFNEYKGNIKDLRVYNKAFYDKDVFEYVGPYDTELGLIDTLDNEYEEYIMVDQGNYIIKGYFEGIAEPHKWRIYNSINYNVLISGTSINYYYDGVDPLYKDDYKILDMVTNKTYDIVDMGPPGSIKVFINSKVCTGSNFVIRAYRRDSGVFIGEYELDKTRDPYECTIHNLDTTKPYDIMLFDKNNNVESRVMSNRSPEAY